MGAVKKYLTADVCLRDAWRLASAIRGSGWRPDWLVGLWRGGTPTAIAVHEFFKATGWNVRHLPLKCWSYTGIAESSEKVEFLFGDEVFGLFSPDDKVLFVDDVFDTGGTAAAVAERSRLAGVEGKYACLYWKRPQNKTSLVPDFYVADTGGDWLVFPHELDGLSADEVREKDPLLHKLANTTEYSK